MCDYCGHSHCTANWMEECEDWDTPNQPAVILKPDYKAAFISQKSEIKFLNDFIDYIAARPALNIYRDKV